MENNRPQPVQDAILYDFSALQWTGVSLDHMHEYLIKNIGLISQNPEREAETLGHLLSRRLEVKESQLVITDGATGAIYLVASSNRGAKSLLLTPCYMEMHHALSQNEHQVTEMRNVKDLSKLDVSGQDFVWISTPSSPDGRTYSRRSLLNVIRENPNVTFVVDITMSAYLLEDTLKAADIRKYKNLVIISSFSKSYNLAGLRVGYIASASDKCDVYRKNSIPRSISPLAVEAARFVLLHPATFTIPIRKWHRESKELQQDLEELDGVEIVSSGVPYFVLRLREFTAQELAEYLLENHRIKVATAEMGFDLQPNEICVSALPKFELNNKLTKGVRAFLEAKQSESDAQSDNVSTED